MSHYRRTRTARVALLAMLLTACEGGASTKAAERLAQADAKAAAAVRAGYPELRVGALHQAAPVPGTPYRSGVLWFPRRDNPQEHGSIVALWTADEGRVAWTHELREEIPHSLVWVDANRDGRTDLFFYTGTESFVQTFLFINRMKGDSVFSLAYHNAENYSTLVDLDDDGTPELIDPQRHAHGFDVCALSAPPEAVDQQVQREYSRVHPYAKDEEGGTWTLHLTDSIRILQPRGDRIVDATRAYPRHLRWRIGVLDAYRATASPACRAHLDRRIAYLRRAGG